MNLRLMFPLSAFVAALVMVGAAGVESAAMAAPKKASARAGKAIKKPVAKPVVVAAPVIPGGFMVPKEILLKNPTPAEAQANAVWSLRAALNVAALQCQYSAFLATVKNYNDFLRHHGEELVRAQTVLIGYFRRTDGPRAPNSFDQYTTRTYNSYSTLDAQYNFCNAAGLAGRRVLAIGKDQLGPIALARTPEIRAALMPQPLAPGLAVLPLTPFVLSLPAPDA